MADSREVVVTGTGLVTSIGIGREAFLASIADRQSGVRKMPEFDETEADCPFRIGAPVDDFDARKFVHPRKAIKAMCREVQTGFAAAELARKEAHLEKDDCVAERVGVIYGSELLYCRLEELEEVYRNCLVEDQYLHDRWGERSMADIFPLWMLKHLPNMAACQVGIALDARGPNNSICHDDVSGLLAVIEASQCLARDAADVMLAGGSSSRLNIAKQVYRDNAQLSRRVTEPAEACRPLDATRDGTVAGEGAGTVLLEQRRHAESRGAQVLARVAGFGRSCETRADSTPSDSIARSIRAALKSSGMQPDDIGFVNAFACGSVDRDAVEAQAICQVLPQTPVTALKSYFGYIGSGAAAIDVAAAVVALDQGKAPPTLNYRQADDNCPVNVIRDQDYLLPQRTALVTASSPYGPSAAIVLVGE